MPIEERAWTLRSKWRNRPRVQPLGESPPPIDLPWRNSRPRVNLLAYLPRRAKLTPVFPDLATPLARSRPPVRVLRVRRAKSWGPTSSELPAIRIPRRAAFRPPYARRRIIAPILTGIDFTPSLRRRARVIPAPRRLHMSVPPYAAPVIPLAAFIPTAFRRTLGRAWFWVRRGTSRLVLNPILGFPVGEPTDATAGGRAQASAGGLDAATAGGRDRSTNAGVAYVSEAGRARTSAAGTSQGSASGRAGTSASGTDQASQAGRDEASAGGNDSATAGGHDTVKPG